MRNLTWKNFIDPKRWEEIKREFKDGPELDEDEPPSDKPMTHEDVLGGLELLDKVAESDQLVLLGYRLKKKGFAEQERALGTFIGLETGLVFFYDMSDRLMGFVERPASREIRVVTLGAETKLVIYSHAGEYSHLSCEFCFDYSEAPGTCGEIHITNDRWKKMLLFFDRFLPVEE